MFFYIRASRGVCCSGLWDVQPVGLGMDDVCICAIDGERWVVVVHHDACQGTYLMSVPNPLLEPEPPPESPLGRRSEEPTLPSVDAGVPDFNPNRDRIVILGRRRSGKTIYLATLYEELRLHDEVHMRSLDGVNHELLLKIRESLKNQEWPAATGGNTESRFEITFKRQVFTMVLLDYPGEVFRKAFIQDINAPDTNALREHVDKACAVISLIDPGNLLDGSVEEQSDDEFGMAQALYRVRRSPGGASVPIAIVLTKFDKHGKRLKRLGGFIKFRDKHLKNIHRIGGLLEWFRCSAVRSIRDAGDRDVPDTSRKPEGVIAPIRWVLDQILINQQRERVHEQRLMQESQRREAQRAAVEVEFVEKQKQRRFWLLFIILMSLVGSLAIGSAILWVNWPSPEVSPEVTSKPEKTVGGAPVVEPELDDAFSSFSRSDTTPQDDLASRVSQAIVEFDSEISRAEEQLVLGDYDVAQRTAITAKIRLARHERIIPDASYREMSAVVEDLLDRISEAKINEVLGQQGIEREKSRRPPRTSRIRGDLELFSCTENQSSVAGQVFLVHGRWSVGMHEASLGLFLDTHVLTNRPLSCV